MRCAYPYQQCHWFRDLDRYLYILTRLSWFEWQICINRVGNIIVLYVILNLAKFLFEVKIVFEKKSLDTICIGQILWSSQIVEFSVLCRTLDSLWCNIMYDHSWFARNIQQMGSNPILQSYSLVSDCETPQVVNSPRKRFFYTAFQIYLWGVLFQVYL